MSTASLESGVDRPLIAAALEEFRAELKPRM
jgi:hypothetical protein